MAQTLPGGQKDWSSVRSEMGEELTPYEGRDLLQQFSTSLGTQKDDPVKNAHTLRPRPWTIEVGGMCANPGVYGLEDFHPAREDGGSGLPDAVRRGVGPW